MLKRRPWLVTGLLFLFVCDVFGKEATEIRGRLFSMNLPVSKWNEFKAAGFKDPVSGIVFRSSDEMPGMPVGGLGTGFISLGTDGTLDYYSTLFNNHMERRRLAAGQAAVPNENLDLKMRRRYVPQYRQPFLYIEVDGMLYGVTTRLVQAINGTAPGKPMFRYAKAGRFWGHYPVADMQYDFDGLLPVSVDVRAWSPFAPGDAEFSNTPGAVFEITVCNVSDESHKASLAFNFLGPRESETGGPAKFRRQQARGEFSGVVVSTQQEDKTYEYALGVAGDHKVRVGGDVPRNLGVFSLSDLPPVNDGASSTMVVDFDLGPKETKTYTFVLSWYAPRWRTQVRGGGFPDGGHSLDGQEFWGHSTLVHKYANRFEGALDVAEYLASQHEQIIQRILAWQAVVYNERKLPTWLRDSLINIFAVLAQNSFWANNADSSHWWGDEGIFCVNESLVACPQQACIANDEWGEWPVDIFFPKLAQNKLRIFKHHQKENGQTPSTLGSGSEPDGVWYNQQLPVDGQVYIHMADRIWQVTGNDDFLREYYPSVKAGFNFMKTIDQDGDGLIEVKGSNQYYDNWPAMAGPAVHISGYWLATIQIVERMANKMGDEAFAKDCAQWFGRGSKSLEEKLWNEHVGSYLLYNQVETGIKSDSILSDQLIGQWFAHLHDLPRVFPKKRVNRVLETLWTHNVKAANFGIRTAIKPSLATDVESFQYGMKQCPSYSSLVPSMMMIFEGDKDKGVEIMRQTWHKMVVDGQMMWDMPCQISPEGKATFGLEYYHNTMLWTLPMALLNEDLRTFCTAGGMAKRIIEAGSQ